MALASNYFGALGGVLGGSLGRATSGDPYQAALAQMQQQQAAYSTGTALTVSGGSIYTTDASTITITPWYDSPAPPKKPATHVDWLRSRVDEMRVKLC